MLRTAPRLFPALAAAAGLLLTAPAAAAPEDYTFEDIASTEDGYFSFEEPVINDSGDVVFYALIEDGAGGYIRGFYRGPDHAGADTIVEQAGGLTGFDSDPALFSDGRIAFIATLPNGERAVLIADGAGSPSLLAETSGPFDDFHQLSAGVDDTLVIRASTDNGFTGLFDGPNPLLGNLVVAKGDITSISRHTHAHQGVYVFPAGLATGARALLVGPDPVTDIVADDTGIIDLFTQYDIAEDGSLLFSTRLDDGTSALFVGGDLVQDLVVDTTGPFRGFNTVARSTRDIAWFGSSDTVNQGVWTGPDPEADRVIGTDDPLFGSTVQHVDLSNRATWINELGQIVMEYELDDGREGIALATPDRDHDGVADRIDLCLDVPNGDLVFQGDRFVQIDSDDDGYGNACDGDFNQDGYVGGPDFDTFLSCFDRATGGGGGPADDPECLESDMNADGYVGGPDFDLFLAGFDAPPGPVGELAN